MHKINQHTKILMKHILALISFIFLFSCGKKEIIFLPEVNSSQITEVLDVSPAYIFYDETKTDSVELNRKNLIISTNWLFNVDKRLTLEQAIPKIKFLQNKKRNAKMHKNDAARNYYTCNDTSIKNLGFIDFTETIYQTELKIDDFIAQNDSIDSEVMYFSKKEIALSNNSFSDLNSAIKRIKNNNSQVILVFDKTLSFQNYITYKALIESLKIEHASINNNEFIY